MRSQRDRDRRTQDDFGLLWHFQRSDQTLDYLPVGGQGGPTNAQRRGLEIVDQILGIVLFALLADRLFLGGVKVEREYFAEFGAESCGMECGMSQLGDAPANNLTYHSVWVVV